MLLEAQNRREMAYFIAACGRALSGCRSINIVRTCCSYNMVTFAVKIMNTFLMVSMQILCKNLQLEGLVVVGLCHLRTLFGT